MGDRPATLRMKDRWESQQLGVPGIQLENCITAVIDHLLNWKHALALCLIGTAD